MSLKFIIENSWSCSQEVVLYKKKFRIFRSSSLQKVVPDPQVDLTAHK